MRDELIHRFRRARRDRRLVVIEGFHALKHALRFGAEPTETIAVDPEGLEHLAARLAPDLHGRFVWATRVDEQTLERAVPLVPRTGVVAIAPRPQVDLEATLAAPGPEPVVLLEDPRNMGNIGACVRVCAAAGAAAMLTTGENDPWFPDAVRGAAGLQFALPVAPIATLPETDRPLVAVDPDGEELGPGVLPPRAVLAFGTERHGLTGGLLKRAEHRIAIPMRSGVSSLNLATSVAVSLYAWRLGSDTVQAVE